MRGAGLNNQSSGSLPGGGEGGAASRPSNGHQEGDEALRARLREALRSYSFAAIGRVTGYHRENVRRYLAAGSLPASFVREVCAGFGLSPAWVLLGKGPVLLDDPAGCRVHEAPLQALLGEVARRIESPARRG